MADQIRSYLRKCNTDRLENFYKYIEMILHERDLKNHFKAKA